MNFEGAYLLDHIFLRASNRTHLECSRTTLARISISRSMKSYSIYQEAEFSFIK